VVGNLQISPFYLHTINSKNHMPCLKAELLEINLRNSLYFLPYVSFISSRDPARKQSQDDSYYYVLLFFIFYYVIVLRLKKSSTMSWVMTATFRRNTNPLF
jgi:hypothetical protein